MRMPKSDTCADVSYIGAFLGIQFSLKDLP